MLKAFGLLLPKYNAFKDLTQSLARLYLCFKLIDHRFSLVRTELVSYTFFLSLETKTNSINLA